MTTATATATLDPTLTLALAQASVAAYSAFSKTSYAPPTDYRQVDSWTGWDAILGTGTEELYGLVFQSTQAGQEGTYIFAFRGTDSDMDIYEDVHFETVKFQPYAGTLASTAHVAGGFYGVYDLLGGSMTQSMRDQLFALLAKYQPSMLYVTGHSLGAALSELFSLDVAVSQPGTQQLNINFSSPMVGIADWQATYQAKLSDSQSIRCYNYWDYVPSLPPSGFGYVPVGGAFRTAFYVQGEWYPHIISRHSIVNLQTVLTHALSNQPQVWSGTFPDYVDPSLTMLSEVPPGGPDAAWADKAQQTMAAEQATRAAG